MRVHVQLSGLGEQGEHFAFEVVSMPVVEGPLVHHEEAGVDPMVGQPRLFDESRDPPSVVPLESAVRRRQWNGGDGHRPGMRPVELEQRGEVYRCKTVTVGDEEGPAESTGASDDPSGGSGLLAGVDHLGAPALRQVLGEAHQQIGAVPAGEDEIGESLPCVDAHQVTEDRLVADLHERLGHLEALRVCPGPFASAEDQGLHKHRSGPWDMPADAIGGLLVASGRSPGRDHTLGRRD